MKLTLITDGAYSSARDQGGAAGVFLKDGVKIAEYSKSFKKTTNNQMEIIAVMLGLRSIKKPIDELEIISDSQYVIGCASKGWQRKKNVKLWKLFDTEYQRVTELCPNIHFTHVKGHSGDYWNEHVDKLAVMASQII